MLSSLSIRDVVLIDRLDLQFEGGLGVLSGETGAGKSILLDAVGLAIGMRAEARLVRHGEEKAGVTAVFEIDDDDPIRAQLADQGVDTAGEDLILRRVLGTDGRSRAFINDQAVSVGLLKSVGDQLIEIHGQFENQRLLQPANHRRILDAFGGLQDRCARTASAYEDWQAAAARLAEARAEAASAKENEDFIRHAVSELTDIDPKPGEEKALAEKRTLKMHGEKLSESLDHALVQIDGPDGVESRLHSALGALERSAENAAGRFADVIATLERAVNEATEANSQMQRLGQDIAVDPDELEHIEERLFALRALARKHDTAVDDLPELCRSLAERLAHMEDSTARIDALETDVDAARQTYIQSAGMLTEARQSAAQKIDQRVAGELVELKLENATFLTEISALSEEYWTADGTDRVAFLVATNPDTPVGPIDKIASGGEMARFMLALKVVLAEADPIFTMIFDEVDSGIGGATAAAVGERLARLSGTCQVLVVTHSPQVAARADHHWRVSKAEAANDAGGGRVWTTVDALDDSARQEEIARMLAGAQVTDEARAAADSLLGGAGN